MRLTRMFANPHFYDYFHSLAFGDSGEIDFWDGAGQRVNTVAKGKYQVTNTEGNVATVKFYDVAHVNPLEGDKRIEEVEEFTINVTREFGVFPFAEEIPYRIKDEMESPCLLYRVRYVFNSDPLAFGRTNQMRNLYYMIESRELENSARYYYASEDEQKLTWRQMQELGIPKEQLITDVHSP